MNKAGIGITYIGFKFLRINTFTYWGDIFTQAREIDLTEK